MEHIVILGRDDIFSETFNFFIRKYDFVDGARKKFCAKPIEWIETNDSTLREPTLSISRDDRASLQELFETLYEMGFRPSRDKGDSGLIATKYHLEDMRTLVFQTLKVKK